jgi:outer membrane biosynthesis protein TonB
MRIGETGRVVLRFTVNADGKAAEPITSDDGQSLRSSERLIAAAKQ